MQVHALDGRGTAELQCVREPCPDRLPDERVCDAFAPCGVVPEQRGVSPGRPASCDQTSAKLDSHSLRPLPVDPGQHEVLGRLQGESQRH